GRGEEGLERLVEAEEHEPALTWRISSSVWLRDRVEPGGLPEELRAQLGSALLGLEVYVHKAVAIAEPCGPLKVVHTAPVKVALDRHAVGSGALELGQAGAKKHYAVSVVDHAVRGRDIVGRATVLGDVNLLCVPERLNEFWGPVQRLRAHREPG